MQIRLRIFITFDVYRDVMLQVPENEAVEYLGNITSWDPQLRQLFNDALAKSSERSICSSITRQPAVSIVMVKSIKSPIYV